MVGVHPLRSELAELVLSRTRNAYLWRYPIPDSVEALRSLHEAGVPIGVVSNASGQIEQTLMVAGVCQVGAGPHVPVRVIIDSHVVGVAKPDPAIFDYAMPAFDGIDRGRIAYVGDSVTMDVGGATAAGLVPILVDPYDDHAGASFRRIRSLLDLL
jgi:putative hydrolase of the HAD superfamily